MQDKRYLLSLKELFNDNAVSQGNAKKIDELHAKAMVQLDSERLKKLEHIKRGRKQLESIGAGLLLQLAVREALAEKEVEQEIRLFSVTQLCDRLADLGKPLALEYTYGPQGKPYLKNYPYYFSISHSGDYVFCVLSEQEVGADIQQMALKVNERILQRFFAPEEKTYWEQCNTDAEKRRFFYKMWCRKEAYGKLTGHGIADAVSVNMCVPKAKSHDILWETEEYTLEDGYQIAICKWSSDLE